MTNKFVHAKTHRQSARPALHTARMSTIGRELVGFGICNLILCIVGATGIQFLCFAALFLPRSIMELAKLRRSADPSDHSSPIKTAYLLSLLTSLFALLSLIYVGAVAIDTLFGSQGELMRSII